MLPRLKTHSNELKNPFLELKLGLEENLGQVMFCFGYYTWISIDSLWKSK